MTGAPCRLLLGLLLSFLSLSAGAQPVRIQIWHQMMYSAREVLAQAVQLYEKENPNVHVTLIYKETEELRSSFQAAALGGSGPDLIYGPSDMVGVLGTMKLLKPLDHEFSTDELASFDPLSLVHWQGSLFMVGDTIGNHLGLIYNKNYVTSPPTTTDELIRLAKALTRRKADGGIERYGLVFHMNEPFFFVPWVRGFGGSFLSDQGQPSLNTSAVRQAFTFVRHLKEEQVIPQEADYELANSLFKEGRAAMIINGDWSWGDYLKAGIPIGVAPLPKVSSTGLWPAALVSTKGYGLNANLSREKLPAVLHLLRFLLSPPTQLMFTEKLQSMPSNKEAQASLFVKNSELLNQSKKIFAHADLMPLFPELRAVWDALRPQYQAVMGGQLSPEKAAALAQKQALSQIQIMNETLKPDWQATLVKGLLATLALAALVGLAQWLRRLWRSPRRQLTEVLPLLAPSLLILLLVVVFPLLYGLTLSFSNLSLMNFRNWEIVGFQNYSRTLFDFGFYILLGKTVIWTFTNVLFHVLFGLILALVLNQTLPAKPLWRSILILPWAIPQYISALAWRSFFNQEYGAINTALRELLHAGPVAWLSRPFEAFSACVLTNIWLGYPFMMVVVLAGLQSIPHECLEAARVDGASPWQQFRNITWPLLQPVLRPSIVLGCIWTFNNLNVIWLVSNGGEPADQTHILVSSVYKSAFNYYRYGLSGAVSMMIFLILVTAVWFYLKLEPEKTA